MKNLLQFFAAFFIISSAFAQAPDSAFVEQPDQRTYFSKTYYNPRNNTYKTVASAGYVHYLANDGRLKDIDTNLKLDNSGAYYIIDSGLYNVAFAAAIGQGAYDVAYEVPRPVQPKFFDPGKPPAPITRIRWKILSYGYFDRQRSTYQILQNASLTTPVVSGNVIDYLQVFSGIDIRYLCQNSAVKEEIVLSQAARSGLPDPAKFNLSRANTYFVVAMEFLLTPNNINAFARRQAGKTPIKQGNDFNFDGDEPIEFEDEHTTLQFFFPKDYAHAVADSISGFANRIGIKRIFYSQGGKNFMLVGVPWSWVNSAPAGDLIIDPTTNAATNEDVRLYDAGNYGSDTKLAVGKFPNAGQLKSRSLISFSLAGIPSNATVLKAQMKLKYYEKYNNVTGVWVDRWIQAHQMLVGWDEAQADSLKRLTSFNWGAPRGKIGGTNPDANGSYESSLLFVEDEALPVWKSWDLTALTQKWLSGAAANYGVILWATNENTSGYVLRFYSSEATNTSDRPYLEVVWSQLPRTVYFLKDHLGSIRASVQDTSTAPVIGYDDYDPWGYILAGRSSISSGWGTPAGIMKNKFTGKEWDDEFGVNWNYFGARYYDPLIGRWIACDPLAQKYPRWSPYVYSLDNSIRFFDPAGDSVKAYTERLGSATFQGGYKLLSLMRPRHAFIRVTTDTRDVIIELGGPTEKTTPKGNPIIQDVTDEYDPLKDKGRKSVEEAQVERPEGIGPEDLTFENQIIEVAETIKANFKNLLPNYDPLGPNSNSFARFLIEIAGGKIQLPRNAVGRNATEAYIKLYQEYLKKQQEQQIQDEQQERN